MTAHEEIDSIFTRIFDLRGGNKPPPTRVPLVAETVAPITVAASFASKGGAMSKVNIFAMFQKYGFLYLITFIAVILTTVVMFIPLIYNHFFDPEKDDSNFDSPEATHSSRYKKIVLLLLIYHVLFFVCFLLVMGFIYAGLSIYYDAANISLTGVTLSDYFKNIMFTFDNNGTKMSISDFYFSLVIIGVFGYIVYISYFKFAKGFFEYMTFPTYIDPETSEVLEWENPKKFIMFYGLQIMYILAFALMVINYVYFVDKRTFSWVTIILFLLMAFMGLVVKEVLKKNLLWTCIWFALLILIVALNDTVGVGFYYVTTLMNNIWWQIRNPN